MQPALLEHLLTRAVAERIESEQKVIEDKQCEESEEVIVS